MANEAIKTFLISSAFGFSLILLNLLIEMATDAGASAKIITILGYAYSTFLIIFICFISYIMISFLYDALTLLKEQMNDKDNGRGRF